jgi:hypothetical protein
LGKYSDEEEDEATPSFPAEVDRVGKEMAAYLLEQNERRLDVLDWWKANQARYPCLARVARRNLSVQATSSQAERDFSVAGQVVSKKRVSLSPETVNICTFCSINREYVPKHDPT